MVGKVQGWKMQDWKTTDVARVENAKLEIVGQKLVPTRDGK